MCVPAHDDRDFEFAKKFDIPIVQVIAPDGKENPNLTEAYTGPGIVFFTDPDHAGAQIRRRLMEQFP